MKLIMENWKRFIKESAMSGNGPLAEPAYRDDDDPLAAAAAGIEAMPAAEKEKAIALFLSKLDTSGLQEAQKSNSVVKALTKLPGGRDMAAMYFAATDRTTPATLRLLALYAVLNLVSPYDMSTLLTVGLDTFLGPLAAIDDIYLLKRMIKKYREAGLPSEKHQDKVAELAGEEMSDERTADMEIEKAEELATARTAAAISRDKLKQLE
tara:strand:- start:131 stop:757 length:627 start_codon:yes stop_codon:yes gene_type:complete